MNADWDDALLVSQLAAGSEQAFSQIYRRYVRQVWHFVRLYLRASDEEVEDVVQDVFLQLWDSRARLRTDRPLDGWLFILTRNRVFNLQRAPRLVEAVAANEIPDTPDSSSAIDEDVELRDLMHRVEQLIQQMPARRREVFLLSRKRHLTYREIADRLQLSEKTVEYHIREALSFLRKHLLDLFLLLWVSI